MNLKVETLLRIGGPGLVEKARLAARPAVAPYPHG